MPSIEKTPQIDPDMRAVLRWEEESGERREMYFKEGDMAEIGRGKENDLVLEAPNISRHHAIVVWKEEDFYLKDLGSKNGSKVNSEKIDQEYRLKDGDIIRLASTELGFFELKVQAPIIEEDFNAHETLVVRRDSAQPRLLITSGPHEGKKFLLSSGKMVIGRATSKASWDISLQDKGVSRPQAEIFQKDDSFKITDLDSANGTLVNGEQITETTELQDGDVIEVGETTILFRSR